MRQKVVTLLLGCLIFTAATVIGLSSGVQPAAGALEVVTFMLPTPPIPEYAALFVGIEKGFFRDEGFDVKIQSARSGQAVIAQVVSGNADFANTTGPNVISAFSQGITEFVSVYQGWRKFYFNLVARAGEGINTPRDLKGKVIGAFNIGGVSYLTAQAILDSAGFTWDDVTVKVVGFAMPQALKARSVDAVTAWEDMVIAMEHLGEKVKVFRGSDYLRAPADTIVVGRKMIEKSPEKILRFLRAYDKALRYAIENPDFTFEATAKFVPEFTKDLVLSKKRLDFTLTQSYQDLWTKTHGFGLHDREEWVQGQEFLYKYGGIKKKSDVSQMFTNDFVDQIRKGK